jgi:hypothetical protein
VTVLNYSTNYSNKRVITAGLGGQEEGGVKQAFPESLSEHLVQFYVSLQAVLPRVAGTS